MGTDKGDPQEGKGLYSTYTNVYTELNKNNLQFVYQKQTSPSTKECNCQSGECVEKTKEKLVADDAITEAVEKDTYFIACYSKEFNARGEKTYMREELRLAIDRLQKTPRNRLWFVPVLLNDTEIPADPTLQKIDAVPLFDGFFPPLDFSLTFFDP